MATITTGLDFGRAFCDHFGLPQDQVQYGIQMQTGANEIFTATAIIALAADDLAAIAIRMGGHLPADLVEIQPIGGKAHYVPCGAPHATRARPINFDAWMRNRTDAAHAAYMARHSRGGESYDRPRAYGVYRYVDEHGVTHAMKCPA